MPWLPKAVAGCDSCPLTRAVVDDRAKAIQLLRAGGWAHMQGETVGGKKFETILCPGCRKDEKRRSRTKMEMDQEALPLDWEKGRVIGGQGVSSR